MVTFSKECIVNKSYTLTPEDFMKIVRAVRRYPSHKENSTYEYCFYIDSGIRQHVMETALRIYSNKLLENYEKNETLNCTSYLTLIKENI